MTPQQAEALRQQALMRLLWRDEGSGTDGLAGSPARIARGLAAYRRHAGALAARALGAAFPTVAQLVGTEAMAALARSFWHAAPPLRGDMAQWGADLPGFIGAAPDLATVPYLADVARLDWAVHRAASAPDAPGAEGPAPPGLQRLGDTDPAQLGLVLAPGAAIVASLWPIGTIWHAHRSDQADRFAPARAALARAEAECGFVWRRGLAVQVAVLARAERRFVRAALRGRTLEQALAIGGRTFDFEAWLIRALRCGWLVAVGPSGAGPRESGGA